MALNNKKLINKSPHAVAVFFQRDDILQYFINQKIENLETPKRKKKRN